MDRQTDNPIVANTAFACQAMLTPCKNRGDILYGYQWQIVTMFSLLGFLVSRENAGNEEREEAGRNTWEAGRKCAQLQRALEKG